MRIKQQMAEAKKNERTDALKEVKRLCKEFGFTAGMLKDSLADGRKKMRQLQLKEDAIFCADKIRTARLHYFFGELFFLGFDSVP